VYDTLRAPPAPGSPMEMICVYVFNTRQRAQYIQTLLTMPSPQTEDRAKTLRELLQTYSRELFPYHERQEEKQSLSMQEIMERELARGPLVVVAEQTPSRKKSKR
jgi:hypothetical protein